MNLHPRCGTGDSYRGDYRAATRPETGEWKYLIAGNMLVDEPLIVVAKLALTGTLVLITVYRIE